MIVHIGIGSNLGERADNCQKAIELLRGKAIIIRKISSLYETEPWGIEEQPKFINLAIEVETTLSPHALLSILKDIENKIGRVKTLKWGPRTIDLDILFYGDEIINLDDIQIPHKLLHQRDFVLLPLIEIAPDKIHPVLKKTIKQLMEEFKDAQNIKHQKQDKNGVH